MTLHLRCGHSTAKRSASSLAGRVIIPETFLVVSCCERIHNALGLWITLPFMRVRPGASNFFSRTGTIPAEMARQGNVALKLMP